MVAVELGYAPTWLVIHQQQCRQQGEREPQPAVYVAFISRLAGTKTQTSSAEHPGMQRW